MDYNGAVTTTSERLVDDELYALYLGTFVTLRTALRMASRSRVQQIITDAMLRSGHEKLASVLAVTDARWGRRRSRSELLGAISDAQCRPDWHA